MSGGMQGRDSMQSAGGLGLSRGVLLGDLQGIGQDSAITVDFFLLDNEYNG